MLDVLLLERPGEHCFYFERHPLAKPAAEKTHKKSGRLHRTRNALRKSYEALESKLPIEERLCSNLRNHEGITLHVPSHVSPDAATRLFLSFLKKCVKTHRRWLLADGVLAALGATLVWLPGPNIFFLYPAIRALGHYYAQAGGSKHQKPKGLTVQHCALLDGFPRLSVPEMMVKSEEIESKFGFNQLGSFLRKKYGAQ
ncbi:MAG TPA: hypothetical protein VGL91_04880 [Acidobacteriota bacterium]